MHCVELGYKITGLPEWKEHMGDLSTGTDFVKSEILYMNENVCVMNWLQPAGESVPWHHDGKQRGEGLDDWPIYCSYNFLLEGSAPIRYRDTEYHYKSALVRTDVDHCVDATETDRKLLKIVFHTMTLEEVHAAFNEHFEYGEEIPYRKLLRTVRRIVNG